VGRGGAGYVTHLLAHGRVVVGVTGGSVVGFGATRQIGRGPGAVSMLWPLLYLRGRVDAVEPPDGWRAEPATPAEVAALELAWTGVDRSEDHLAWARRPGGAGLPLVGLN
jgi:hypothetical protein